MLYLVPRTHVAGLGTRFVSTAVTLNFCTLTFVKIAERAHAEGGRSCLIVQYACKSLKTWEAAVNSE